MRLSLVLVISAALVASGCTSLFGSDMSTNQQFKSQLQDMTESDYHVKYEISASGDAGVIEGLVQSPEIYSQGDQSKLIAGFSMGIASGEFAAYDLFGGSPVTCTTGSSNLGTEGSGNSGPSCEKAGSDQNLSFTEDKIDEFLNNVSLELKGTESVVGRECNMYRIKADENVTEDLPSGASNYDEGQINLCLDASKGYPAILSVKANQTSDLRESEEGLTEVFRLEATEYDTNFPDGLFEVPVDITAGLSCDPFEATVTTFDYSGEVQISANGNSNTTHQVSADSEHTFSLDSANKEDYSNEITVYTDNGESQTASCYGTFDPSIDSGLNSGTESQTAY